MLHLVLNSAFDFGARSDLEYKETAIAPGLKLQIFQPYLHNLGYSTANALIF